MLLDAKLPKEPVSEEEFQSLMEAAGLLTRARRDESLWHTDPFIPVEVEGEPLSETIIRERR